MLRIAICDDDPMYLVGMQTYVRRWEGESGISVSLSAFGDGDSLLENAAQKPFDIVFLDIIMPMLNGIDTARELRASDNIVKIVFLTTSPEFALDSYSVKAYDYIVKPAAYERMRTVLNELSSDIQSDPKSLLVRISGGYRKLLLRDIEYLEACNKKVVFYLCSGERVQTPEPLYVWEKALLPADGFFKCHRSYLVNIANIDFFDSGVIHTGSGKFVPIARGYARDFEAAYFSVIFTD